MAQLEPRSVTLSTVLCYGLAVLSVAVALTLSLLLRPFDITVTPFLMAIAVTVWYAGTVPGLFAIVLSVLSLDYFFLPPVHHFEFEPRRLPYFIVFAVFAGIIGWFSSSRRRIEQLLRESEYRWRSLTETLPQLVWSATPHGDVDYFSAQWTRYTGVPESKLLGNQWMAVLHPHDRESTYHHWKEAVADRGAYDLEYRVRRADGVYGWFKTRGVPMRDRNGKIVKWFGTCTDITDRKEAEEALRQNEQELREARDQLEMKVAERTSELRQSEAYLAEAQRLSHTGSFGWDVRAGKLYWSEETYRIFECDPAVVPSLELVLEQAHPDDRHIVQQVLNGFERDRSDFDVEYRLSTARGIKHVRVVGRATGPEDGRNLEIVGAVTDITERKAAEDTLHRSEERYRNLINLSPDAIYVLDANGVCILTNVAGAELAGCTDTEVVGSSIIETYPFEDRHLLRPVFERLNEGPRRFERGFLRRNGEIVPVEVSLSTLHESYYQAVIRDISERKRGEEALRRSESYLAEGQKLTHTGSWAWDVASRENVHWSREHYRLFGLDPDIEVPSFEVALERIHPDDRVRFLGEVDRAVRDKADFIVEFRTVLPDGTVKHVQSVGHPSFDKSGNLLEFVGTGVDITERKRAEEGRERLREAQAELAHINRITTMGELTASLAHEIRQPITAALTNARTSLRWLTREKPSLNDAGEALERIINDVTRASDIIDRLRSMFKKAAPQYESVDINAVIREMTILLRTEAARNSISIHTDVAEDLPAISGDRVQLQQVFMNLMINGMEAMQSANGNGELIIRSWREGDSHVGVSVSDTGMGLPQAETDQIFRAFFTTKPQGTGMGLSISRSIIESHGGRLWASANPRRGSTFRFTLPIVAEAPE